MYAMCTGSAPFRGDGTVPMLRKISDEEPRPLRRAEPGCAAVAGGDRPEAAPQAPRGAIPIGRRTGGLAGGIPGPFAAAGALSGAAAIVRPTKPHPQLAALGPGRRGGLVDRRRVVVGHEPVAVVSEHRTPCADQTSHTQQAANSTSRRARMRGFSRQPLSIPATPEKVRMASFSHDGRFLAVAHGDQVNPAFTGTGSVYVWDVAQRKASPRSWTHTA